MLRPFGTAYPGKYKSEVGCIEPTSHKLLTSSGYNTLTLFRDVSAVSGALTTGLVLDNSRPTLNTILVDPVAHRVNGERLCVITMFRSLEPPGTDARRGVTT